MAATRYDRLPWPWRVSLALPALALLLSVQTADATSKDTRPRPALLLPESGWFVAQDAWDSVALFRIKDGHPLKSFAADDWVRRLAVTADERFLAVACDPARIALWD